MDTQSVPVSKIATRDDWQVRNRLDKTAIARYRTSYANDCPLPPITLADIEGVLFVIDGWHRLAAAKQAGLRFIQAEVITTSATEAVWLAAQANISNGVPLKKSEYRKVFQAFVMSGKHRRGKRYLSYRDISKALSGIAGHTTIRNWMQKDFPVIARNYAADEPQGYKDALPTWSNVTDGPFAKALEQVDNLGAIFGSLSETEKQSVRDALRYRLGADYVEDEGLGF